MATDDALKASLVQSVDRALDILAMLATDGELGVTEMSRTLDVHKSTVSRLVATLEHHGLVEQLSDRGRYQLGLGLVRLAGAASGRLDLVTESRALIRELATQTGETVNLVSLSGLETLYLDQASGGSALQIHNWLGKRNPVYATANGRALLAWRETAEIDRLLGGLLDTDGAFAPLTSHTVTDPAALSAELARVRELGYAVVVDELELGLTAIAAPIHGTDGTVIASLSVSGPSFRLVAERVETTAALLVAAAARISSRMRHFPFAP
ncbi:hypothetical protein GY21_13420 [Cryobacterium roopkundense]|uniref:Glycerol operon regulatory protein n=1 Tax=Cryobacterium roopkundense TaxID=1001240 RepID=A0A099J3S4_9MICO|nr:IclR family transcriptional regulator [Cryobacterium roopkundense]KGJ72705.1 hypothetical protein GY21_13420 [Cryobacterium roopkundense]MBB5641813.1 DNA-binding IclR family transcriptional regulator [Cryobacterium roopkundense]